MEQVEPLVLAISKSDLAVASYNAANFDLENDSLISNLDDNSDDPAVVKVDNVIVFQVSLHLVVVAVESLLIGNALLVVAIQSDDGSTSD
jgi:hypothetical protein